MNGGEYLVFREYDQRFPHTVADERMGEAMEVTIRLEIMKLKLRWLSLHDADLCFPVCKRKGLICRQKRGCRLGSLGRATVLSATRRSWDFDEVCTAIRTSCLGCPPDRWSH